MAESSENPYESPTTKPERSDGDSSLYRALIPLISLGVMGPWPALASYVCLQQQLFDSGSEVIFMFGGVTLLLLIPLLLVIPNPSELLLGLIIGAVWLAAFALPAWMAGRRVRPRVPYVLIFAAQAFFSLAQAGLGLLMLLGKSV